MKFQIRVVAYDIDPDTKAKLCVGIYDLERANVTNGLRAAARLLAERHPECSDFLIEVTQKAEG